MGEWEKWLARVLLLNSALTGGVVLGWLGQPQQGAAQLVLVAATLLGALSAVMTLRGWRAGWAGGALYYALQVLSYYPYSGASGYSVKAGLSIGAVVHLSQGLFVVNVLALALLLATLWGGWRALRRASAPSMP
ncbi:MAG: hypothetical protein ACEQSK_05140 [Sphingomonadaceae bacterium]